MELDDLKETWKQADKLHAPRNKDIMELIKLKSYGPLGALKKSFARQMLIVPLMAVIIINNLSRSHQIFTDVLFWSYSGFIMAVCLFFYFNYRLVKKMEGMDGMLKSNLEQQVAILETRLRWHITGIRIALVFFILLSEILPYFAYEPMLNKWHKVAPLIRVLVYAAFLAFQYFVSRALSQQRYGQHLTYLKNLINEME